MFAYCLKLVKQMIGVYFLAANSADNVILICIIVSLFKTRKTTELRNHKLGLWYLF